MKRFITRVAHQVEQGFDSRRAELRSNQGPFHIVPYRSFGTATRLHIRGRVLRGSAPEPRDYARSWHNAYDAWRRVRSDEVPGAVLEAEIDGHVEVMTTDEEGYFHEIIESSLTDGWREVPLRLSSPREAEAVAEVLVAPAKARFGVISDLDDTVVQTGATKLTSMIRTALLENARTRLPFEGVAEFYSALHAELNPIFYVSSGPWNFYDIYAEFLDHQGIPRGPILLGDYGIDEEKFIYTPHLEHKLRSIRSIIDEYPGLQFVLIGDSGQHDPEIYREVVKEYPGRVLAIYIRDVTLDERDRVVVEMQDALREEVDVVFVEETRLAMEHAAGIGLI
jgi:phosphatidate phosphatase APP1